MKRGIMDMTKGNTIKQLLLFAVPMLIGNVFQQLYNMVDSIVVGKYVNAEALAAVGATSSLNFFFFSFSFGMAAGVGVIVAQYVGAGDETNVKKTIANAIYVISAIAICMSIIGIIFADNILMLLHTPEAILKNATLYMRVTCAGLIAVTSYNAISAILRALGDSKTPLIFLIISSVINVCLDLVFVLILNLGVMGVALATIIAQSVSAISCLIYAYHRIPYFKIPKEYYRPNKALMVRCIRIGIPVSFQNSLIAISCIALQYVINGFGEVVIAANTAVSRFEQLVQQPFASLGAAIVTYTGQNVGAGNIERVKKGFRSGALICAVFSLVLLPVGYFGAEWIMKIFVSKPEVIAIGIKALRINTFFYFALGMIYVARSVLNGTGDASAAMLNGIVEVIGRVGFSKPLTMIPKIGVYGIWYTTVSTWTITAIICSIRYFSGRWKTKGIIDKKG